MEMCQKQTQCPFLKNGCFSVVFHLISGSIFQPIFLKNEIKNEIKNGSKMRTVNTPNMTDVLIVQQFEILIINIFGMHIHFIILQVNNYGGTLGWVTNWTLPQVSIRQPHVYGVVFTPFIFILKSNIQ